MCGPSSEGLGVRTGGQLFERGVGTWGGGG